MKKKTDPIIEAKKDYLESYKRSEKKLQELVLEIQELRETKAGAGAMQIDGMPHAHNPHGLETYYAAVETKLEKLYDKKMALLEKREEIRRYIEQTQDDRYKAILRYRYIHLTKSPYEQKNGLNGTRLRTIEEISELLDYDTRHCYRLYKQALQALQEPPAQYIVKSAVA